MFSFSCVAMKKSFKKLRQEVTNQETWLKSASTMNVSSLMVAFKSCNLVQQMPSFFGKTPSRETCQIKYSHLSGKVYFRFCLLLLGALPHIIWRVAFWKFWRKDFFWMMGSLPGSCIRIHLKEFARPTFKMNSSWYQSQHPVSFLSNLDHDTFLSLCWLAWLCNDLQSDELWIVKSDLGRFLACLASLLLLLSSKSTFFSSSKSLIIQVSLKSYVKFYDIFINVIKSTSFCHFKHFFKRPQYFFWKDTG